MKKLDIAAIGACYIDVNADSFPFTEAGIPLHSELVGNNYELVAGGSAVNFCRLLGALGLETAFIGMTGKDALGDTLAGLLKKDGVQPFLTQKDGLLTNVSFNMTNPDGEHIMCVAGTANSALAVGPLKETFDAAVSRATILYMGGCLKLTALRPGFEELALSAKERAAAIVVDHGRIPAGATPEMLDSVRQLVLTADYYLPSRDEFCALWDVPSIEAGIQELAKKAPQLTIVVKMGPMEPTTAKTRP